MTPAQLERVPLMSTSSHHQEAGKEDNTLAAQAVASTSKAIEKDVSDEERAEDAPPYDAAEDSGQQDKAAHVAIDFPEQPPPEFAPYEAELFIDDGDIVSHDPHLNRDGEALYQFLLTHAQEYPTYVVSCTGTHTEQRTRVVSRTVNGRTQTHTEHYTVTITDFNFSIDLASEIVAGPVHCSLADSDAAYRGSMVRQVDTPGERRKATDQEIAQFKMKEADYVARGLPPWASGRDGEEHTHPLQSAKTLRAWADEYCQSPKILKEFTYKKVIHGWNKQSLENAIRSAIVQTFYRGTIHIDFSIGSNKIHIRPDNRLSRTLSRTLYKVLLWICLVYPFIWLFKRYNRRGGGRWEICMGAYALKHTEVIGEECPVAEGDVPRPGRPPVRYRVVEDQNGQQVKLIGLREIEWFKKWEETIQSAAKSGMIRDTPMTNFSDGPVDHAAVLGDLPL